MIFKKVIEPWDFESQYGENIIRGHIISMKSDRCIVFKSNHYLKFAVAAGYILILTPRYKENDFSEFIKYVGWFIPWNIPICDVAIVAKSL